MQNLLLRGLDLRDKVMCHVKWKVGCAVTGGSVVGLDCEGVDESVVREKRHGSDWFASCLFSFYAVSAGCSLGGWGVFLGGKF